jgi:deoxyribonuclease-4
MIYIGNHQSVAKGFQSLGENILSLGGDTAAFFTRNPRGGKAVRMEEEDIRAFLLQIGEHRFGPLVAHAPYTMNVCAANPETLQHSRDMLKEDLHNMRLFPGAFYNFHPGSHVGQGKEEGIRRIADALNTALADLQADQDTTVLLETMAGKGSEVGSSFEELQSILERCDRKERIGVCFDTCHVWDAGYDVRDHFDEVLQEFDKVIGLKRLYAVHFNDSCNECGSHKDRHEKLGQGKIGMKAMHYIAMHPLLQGRPFILETPNDDAGYKAEIETVRGWMK